MAFTHLHLHTDFSLLDSMIKIPELVKKIKELGMTSCAITDHGTAAGLVQFYNECKKEGIKPILGIEAYEAPESRFDKKLQENPDNYYHLILLVKNETGYKNLCKLVSRSNTEGFYYKPRIDFELLKEFHEGLICTTACVAGRVQRSIVRGDLKQAESDLLRYKELFGEDFYLEIQNHGIKEEKIIAQKFIEYSKKYNIKLICTNDCHYLNTEDALAHEWMLCIQTEKKMTDESHMRYQGDYSVKSEAQMRDLFPGQPEAFDNTQEIVEKCNFDFTFGVYKMPKVYIPEDFDYSREVDYITGEILPDDEKSTKYYRYLKYLAFKGLEDRYPDGHGERDMAIKRLEYELSIIKQMEYSEYFLDTLKTIRWANENHILTGLGRGSAAGSVLCYCLGITGLDPLKYDLLFERFLNPERISMPDIDVDYNYAHKDEVIKSEAESNGIDHFAKIQTFMTMAAKGVVKDCARVAGYEPAVGNKLSKMIGDSASLKEAYENNPEIEDYLSTDKSIRKLWEIATKLEGLKRSASTHACGHIPTYEKCEDLFPCSVDKTTGYLICQYDMIEAEHLGNLKKDLLMLRNLDVIEVAHRSIKERYGIEVLLWTEDILNNPAALKLFCDGDTNGVFQFESGGIKKFMKELKPTCFEDVVAGVALYRPGPMDFIPQYIEGKHNPASTHYLTPELEPILKNTYGCIVYQEQVMQIVRDLAGFSMGRADLVRKYMGKKILDKMEAEGKNFIYGNEELGIPGCVNKGIPEDIAKTLWDQMTEFAKYAFNKSHAACYAAIAMQTAYLKANYPTEFYAGLLSSVMDKTGMLSNYLNECKKKNVEVIPPDINISENSFKVVGDNKITFGLLAIKGIGNTPVNTIISERVNGDYAGLTDFVDRTGLQKGVLEPLIYSGAFDRFGFTRCTLITNLADVIANNKREKKQQVEGQIDLFSVSEGSAGKADHFENLTEFYKDDILSNEKKYCGIYISGHPLDKYRVLISSFPYSEADITGEKQSGEEEDAVQDTIPALADGTEVRICGIIKEVRRINTKKGDLMAFLKIEGMSEEMSVTVFPSVFNDYRHLLDEGNIVAIKGKLSIDEEYGNSVLADRITDPEDIPRELWIKFETSDEFDREYDRLRKEFYNESDRDNIFCYVVETKNRCIIRKAYFDFKKNDIKDLYMKYGEKNVAYKYRF